MSGQTLTCSQCGITRELVDRHTNRASTSLCRACSSSNKIKALHEEAKEKYKNLLGQKFNELTITNIYSEKANNGRYKVYVDADCSCGRKINKSALENIRSNKKKRCGYDHER